MLMKWMTPSKALKREPPTPPDTVFSKGFRCIFGTRRVETTIIEGKNGGKEYLIQSYEKNEWMSHVFPTN